MSNAAATPEPHIPGRIARISRGDDGIATLIGRLVDVSVRGLPGMFRTESRCFAHTRRRGTAGLELAGTSVRYGAISLLGLRHVGELEQRAALGGESAVEYAERLAAQVERHAKLGDVALITWAAAECGAPGLPRCLARLRALWAQSGNAYVVETAWVLSALVAGRDAQDTRQEAEQVRHALVRSLAHGSPLFPHWIEPGRAPFGRRHVGCFADQVYPIQALARYHTAFGDARALEVANACAARICELQGAGGQWWWHYDARNGSLLEGYPVYSVHQDAMAPMALLDLAEAGGEDFAEPIRTGLRWMERAPEVGHSLIDDEIPLIWRKVARREPRKATRRLRAGLSALHPALRWRWLDERFPPTEIDWESRPYHLGWVLHAWLS